jgi:CheY-specific phosphatase CheX
MMDLEVAEGWTLPDIPASERMTSAVHLTGDWNGAVLLECDRRQACHFAGRFLSMDTPPAEVDDVVRDVLGELANMIGGNLKCIMTHGIRLSMPTVTDGGSGGVRICGASIQERLTFRSAVGTFGITVLTTNLLP